MADHINLALSLFQDGKLVEAQNVLQEIIAASQDEAFTWFLLAVIHMQRQKFTDAISCFESAISLQPNYPDAINNLGVALEAENQPREAKICYKDAINLKNNYANAYYNLANIEKNEGDFDSAIGNYQSAIKYNAKYSNAMNNLALIYQYRGKYIQSGRLFERALKYNDTDLSIKNNLGFNYYCTHQYIESERVYNSILNSNPNHEPTLLNLGLLSQAMLNGERAKKLFHRIPKDSTYHIQAMSNLAYLELSNSNFESGWKYYANRPSIRNLSFLNTEILPKSIKDGNVLLYKDQGIGDEIFFSRYIYEFEKHCEKLSYYTDEKLTSIWKRTLEHVEVITKEPQIANFDITISMGDLPRLLNQKLHNSIPSSIHFIPTPEAIRYIENILPNNGKPNIAVTWEAGITGQNTLFKRVPPEFLGKQLAHTDANILIIQRNPLKKDIKVFEKHLKKKAYNFSFTNNNLEDMLALLSIVDDYVCVSNTNNHLRVALNLPSKVLVPYPPEWRWLNEGCKSPWFPRCQIYRQDRTGDWEGFSID